MKQISIFFRVCLLIILCVQINFAQVDKTPLHHFTFDSCNLVDAQKKASSSSVGPLTCDCGVVNKALKWNGGLNFVNWDAASIQSLFTGDFTVSFYFKPDRKLVGLMDIISKRGKCGIDSLFAMRYLADNHTLTVDLIGRVENIGTLSVKLDQNYCWFYVAFTKQGQKLTLYVNGEEKAFKINNYTITVQNSGKFSLANSPCIGVSDIRFNGVLDELKLYSSALSKDEIKRQYKEADKLLTKDTVILKGQSVNVRANISCSNSYSWAPIDGVQNPKAQTTRITPAVTTIYYLTTIQNECKIKDSIKITVVDASVLDCNNINIPTAFTPNDDGLNDVFRVTNHYVITSMKSFDIFDRWGGKIFSGTSPLSAWDGTIKGVLANPGIYVYHLKYTCNGSDKHKSGSFSLIR